MKPHDPIQSLTTLATNVKKPARTRRAFFVTQPDAGARAHLQACGASQGVKKQIEQERVESAEKGKDKISTAGNDANEEREIWEGEAPAEPQLLNDCSFIESVS